MRKRRADSHVCNEGAICPGTGLRMIRLAGSAEQVGAIWGEMNKAIIARDMEADYLERAAAAGISRKTLIERPTTYVRMAEKVAPHWLEQWCQAQVRVYVGAMQQLQ